MRSNGAVSLDDPKYLTANPQVQAGLTAEGVRWALTTDHTSNWHPLTWLSLMLDVQLFGVDVPAVHLVNVALHALNAVLVFLLFSAATGATWRSAFVAGVFALHPLHVESVAWLSERKDVLSGACWLAATLAYVRYVRGGSRWAWAGALALFAAGLAAKPTVVTWPFALLLFDVWPLRRARFDDALRGRGLWPLVREKLPFFALSAASAWITALRGAYYGHFTFGQRVGNALVSYARYLGKALWPADLAALYPHPGDWPLVAVAGAALLLLAASAAAWLLRRRAPYALVGWLFFLGTLLPAIGLVQVGYQAMADRYMYLPLLGLAWIVAWGAPDLLRHSAHARAVLAVAAVASLLALGVVSQRQVSHWKSSDTLYAHALAVTTDNWLIHFFQARNLLFIGKFEPAAHHLREVVRVRPDHALAWQQLGIAYARLGRAADAAAAQAHAREAARRGQR